MMYRDVATMMTFGELAKTCSWKITDGSVYLWKSYGPNCRFVDFEDTLWRVSVVFNTDDMKLREVTGNNIDYNGQPWKWIDPDFRRDYNAECDARNESRTEAWAGCRYVTILNIVDVYAIIDNMKDKPNE